jgi:hypothetical protein
VMIILLDLLRRSSCHDPATHSVRAKAG